MRARPARALPARTPGSSRAKSAAGGAGGQGARTSEPQALPTQELECCAGLEAARGSPSGLRAPQGTPARQLRPTPPNTLPGPRPPFPRTTRSAALLSPPPTAPRISVLEPEQEPSFILS